VNLHILLVKSGRVSSRTLGPAFGDGPFRCRMCGPSGSLPIPSHFPGHSKLIVFRAVARRTSMCCHLKKGMYHRPVRIFVQVTVGHFNGNFGNMRASGVETRKIITQDFACRSARAKLAEVRLACHGRIIEGIVSMAVRYVCSSSGWRWLIQHAAVPQSALRGCCAGYGVGSA
jgi:hypothetical protein